MLGERDQDVRIAARALRAAGTPYVIATVVRVQGSSYRRPGARMVMTETARVAGSVSGGCLEASLVRTAWWRTQAGPVVVTYDSSDPDDPDAVLGCGGIIDILIERGGAGDPLAEADRLLALRAQVSLVTVIASTNPARPIGTHALRDGGGVKTRLERDGDVELLVEPIAAAPHLFVFGTGLDAIPLVEQVVRLGWSVSVWNGGGRFGVQERFPAATVLGPDLARVREDIAGTARPIAVVMGHDTRRDREALAMLLDSTAQYIGILGPRHRTLELVDDARVLADPRIHAPVGLDLGAETPDEIALSVTAEALVVLRGATAAHLRARATIHADAVPRIPDPSVPAHHHQ